MFDISVWRFFLQSKQKFEWNQLFYFMILFNTLFHYKKWSKFKYIVKFLYRTITSLISDTLFQSPRWRVIPLLAFPYVSCFSTSLSMTFTRCVAGFALTEDGDSSELSTMVYLTYILLISFCWVVSYIFLNKSLKFFSTVYVVPLFKVGDLLHNLLSGGIFLREFGEYQGSTLFMFLIGIMIWTGSIIMLLLRNDKNEQKSNEVTL